MLVKGFLQLFDYVLKLARILSSDGFVDKSVDSVLEATLWQKAFRREYYQGRRRNYIG